MSSESLLAFVELLLRSGVGVLLLIAALLARDYSRSMAARLAALFPLGTAAYAVLLHAGSARADGVVGAFRPCNRQQRYVLAFLHRAAGYFIVATLSSLVANALAPSVVSTLQAGRLWPSRRLVAWSVLRISEEKALLSPAPDEPAARGRSRSEPRISIR